MAFWFHFGPDLLDRAVLSDQEGDAAHALIFFSHKFLNPPNAVLLRNLMLRIGKQREGQAVLGLELLVAAHVVRTDAEHHRARPLKLAIGIAERARLFGAT